MEASKILEEDKDEWIYNSMKKYSNLYMFELEFPLNALEVTGDMSLCLSGLQVYSKKCEILQMSIPPKLFPKELEEGLCKDRDFQIVSGGYASAKILQIKAIKSSQLGFDSEFVVTTQEGEAGVTIYKLGNEQSAVIREVSKLGAEGTGVIAAGSSKLLLGTPTSELDIWDLNAPLMPMIRVPVTKDEKSPITKVKYWDEGQQVVAIGLASGSVILYDLREGVDAKKFTPESASSSSELVFTFDTLPSKQKLVVADSLLGYEAFDIRQGRLGGCQLPLGTVDDKCPPYVLRDRFDIEFSTSSRSLVSESEFILSGLKLDTVSVLRETPSSDERDGSLKCVPVFVHDGHTKPVSHAAFHKSVERLVFSSSIDSLLHAWQYAEDPDDQGGGDMSKVV